MIRIASAQLWVHDQEEALAFYTEKLGMEVRADVTLPELGGFRWLTVGPRGQKEIELVLLPVAKGPMLDDPTAQALREVVKKGALCVGVLETDDCRATYEELVKRGVEFSQEPTQQPYGIDAGFRDPSGNQMRMATLSDPA